MSSLIRCPHCNTEFALEPLEEPMKPSLTITRKSVERGSWRDIAEIINSGETYRMLSVEDSLSCKLTDGSFASIDVLDINDEEVAFGFHQSFGDSEMNMRNTNAGGFPESRMLQHLNTNIMKLLPDELLEVITPRHIVQNFGGKKFECDAKLWLPSLYEVFGEEYARYCCDENERQFEFFKNPQNRVKFQRDGQYSIYWWLRSPNVGHATTFWSVNADGNVGNYYASNSFGVCPCFIIRKSALKVISDIAE